MQLQHLFSDTDFFSFNAKPPTHFHKDSHYATWMFGFLCVCFMFCRHQHDYLIHHIWCLHFGKRSGGVSLPKLFQSSEARKATKCLLCCWSAAQFFSYVNAVICRWMWWILTSSDGKPPTFFLFFPPTKARTRARAMVPKKLRTFPRWACAHCTHTQQQQP